MKRPLAYITAAWCGEDYKNTEQAARYCRAVYEAGFSPICPTLYLPLFLNDAVPEEHKSGIDMSRDLLRRSHVLVVCGQTVTEAMQNMTAPSLFVWCKKHSPASRQRRLENSAHALPPRSREFLNWKSFSVKSMRTTF